MTTPTKLPIPSNNLLDSRFNFEKLDQIVNSDANYYTDRFGKQRLTVKGLENLANQISIDLENNLATPDGYRMIGKVLSYDALKTITPKVVGQRILVNGYYEGTSLGGGVFEAVSGEGVDDGGYTCVVNSDWYWERRPDNINEINLVDFGLQAGGTLDNFLTAAINYQQRTGLAKVVRVPTLGHTGYILTGGLKFNILYYNLELIGPGELSHSGAVSTQNTKGCVIQHTGNNVGISFEYESFANRSAWANVHVKNFYVRGTSTGKAFVNFSDSWKNKLSDCDIRGYTTGAAYTLTNKVAWTEGFVATDVMTRVCASGCWCYQDPVDLDHVTDSFFGFVMNRCYHSFELTGVPSYGLRVGDRVNKATVYNARCQLGAWASAGGDNILLFVDDAGIYMGWFDANPDGFGISAETAPLTSAAAPVILYKKYIGTLGGYIEVIDGKLLYQSYYDITPHISSGGVVSIYPFKGVYAYSGSNVSLANYRLDEPSTPVIKALGTRIRIYGTVSAGVDLTLRLQRLPPSSIFHVTLRVAGLAPRTYIVKTFDLTGYCTVIREDRQSNISTVTNTTISGTTATSTSTSTATNVIQDNFILRTLGNVGDNVGSTTYYMGCEAVFSGTSLSVNKSMSIDIEWVA